MLTNGESVFLGTVLGGFLTWLIGWTTSRTQWRREERRLQNERRGALYQDMLAEADQISRNVRSLAAAGKLPAAPLAGQDQALQAQWRARVALFASSDVAALWEAWARVVDATWLAVATSAKREGDAAAALMGAEFSEHLERHFANLCTQMRKELGF